MTFAPSASSIRWLSFRNATTETIPPFAVLRATGAIQVEGQAVLTANQPNSDGGSSYLFNGPFAVPTGGFGSCTAEFPCFAAHDLADAPSTGEEWGAAAGSWRLKKGNSGYKVVGGSIDGRVEIMPSEPADALVHFYLNANLARGGTQSAQVLEWTGALWAPGATTIEVEDSSRIGPAKATQLGVSHRSAESHRYEIITLERSADASLLWAKAIAKWTNLPGNDSHVACHKALDQHGTLDLDEDEEPQTVTVYLPRPGGNVDPNVRSGDVIGYQLDSNGIAIATTDYLDDAIGTVVLWSKDQAEIRGGWRIYAPTPGRFPVGCTTSDEDIPATVPGSTGGQKKHFHDYEKDSITTFETELTLEDHAGIETQPTNLTLLPHIGYSTEPAAIVLAPAGAATAYATGETGSTAPGITGTGVAAVHGTGTASTSSVALTTNSGGGGSALLTGETGDNLTLGFQILDHENHWHQVNATSIVQGWTSGTIRYAYPTMTEPTTIAQSSGGAHLSHTITDLKHRHSLNSTVTLSSHTHGVNSHNHTVSIADVAGGLSVDGSEIAALLTVAGHTHSFEEIAFDIPAHTHAVAPHFHAIPSMEHSLSPNPHNHGVDDLEHELSPNPHDHRMRNTPLEKHIPPWFGIHFIERYE